MELRNCAWITPKTPASTRAIWAREGVIAFECPKSIITTQSLSFLEQFQLWKKFGGGVSWDMEVKTAEAFLVLEEAWRKEKERGQNQ